ncbi:ABC transporter ATP-binding protein/permease [Litorilinea aerophila]|uniref:ABC transporter ATP-binding protein n=1 Tax=Litorilinea aerophila TaxID=1204385 RepID=A0A540VMD8_9CHLR|nr:ABC transporter ATP-binding protein [Litorilinea aerophila]MCC9074629.1 ABC transporter ATP-binding protein/permease [Litorilinea aerophila]
MPKPKPDSNGRARENEPPDDRFQVEDPAAEELEQRSLTEVADQDSALFKLLGSSLAPYKRWLIMALVLMLGTSALNVVPPYLLQQAIDGPIARGEMRSLWWITALYGATALGLYGLTFAFTYFLQQAGQRALADLRSRLFDHILRQDHGFLTQTSTGELVSRLTNDIDQLNAVLSRSIVIVLVEGVTLIVVVVVMFMVNWRLALLSLAVLPVVAVVTRYFRARIRRSSSGERSAQARISAFLNEHLHGMTVVQLFNREDESEREFEAYNKRYREALIELRWHSALFLSVQEILSSVGLGLILYGGGQGVLAGWATLGTLVAFVQYTERAFQPVLRLSQEYNTVQVALGAAERIYAMLNTRPKVQDPPDPVPLTRVRGEIEFRNVHFWYVPDEPVLRGIDLHIPPGQSVAVVGPTGAGKSSLVSLLARHYDPRRGQILLDGVDLRRYRLTDLRRAVAVVPQDPVCLAGTIAFNIRLYRDDLSDEDVRRAAEFSNAARFIEELPGGYDFQVLPNGENLSQGQRQLLALARALALNPEGVLVLDEATSSIDTATEALIQEALERILRTRTSLVIAHRLSTIRNADRIIVMERGRIVEDGDHASLLARGGHYARLHQHQLMGVETKLAG